METLKLPVAGMTCGNCARSIERKLGVTPGVSKATVDLVNGSAIVEYDASAIQPDGIVAVVRKLGFEVPA